MLLLGLLVSLRNNHLLLVVKVGAAGFDSQRLARVHRDILVHIEVGVWILHITRVGRLLLPSVGVRPPAIIAPESMLLWQTVL